jgi:hypothetical protein
VDGYEVPDRLREAVHLINPADVFPYGSNTGRGLDTDHTIPWQSTSGDGDHDVGPPGQTRIGNLGKLTRRHHRIKTHCESSGGRSLVGAHRSGAVQSGVGICG